MVPIRTEPPAKLVIEAPVPEALALGVAVIQYRSNNLRVVPVFGAAALSISPRVGHVHVRLDDASWVWAHASGDPVMLFGLAPGPHTVRLQLMTANHQQLDEGSVRFEVPQVASALGAPAVAPVPRQLPARIIAGPPLPEPLSRGVVLIRYRTENVDIVPVFGPPALAVTPRIGHVLFSVDEAPWYWAEASGNPVIVQGLAPGRHKVVIRLANANHEILDQSTVAVTIPEKNSTQSISLKEKIN